MAKITIEIDTDTKKTTFAIDGQSVDTQEFSVGRYTLGGDYDLPEGGKPKIVERTHVSYTVGDDNNRASYNLCFDDLGSETYEYIVTNYSVAREIGRIHSNHLIAHKMGQSLGKRSPVKICDLSTENKYMQDRTQHMSSDKK